MSPIAHARAPQPDPAAAHLAASDASVPARAWVARLELQFQHQSAATRLVRRRHIGPLLVQKPLYPERSPAGSAPGPSGPCHVYVIHPPGGVASGDELQLHAALETGSHALLTTPAAGKFYRRGDAAEARVAQIFHVRGATLEWLPQENIFYPNSAVDLGTVVHLCAQARFIGWEIACLGLPASGLTLDGGELRLAFELWQDGRPLLLERLVLARPCLSARWGMADHAALGTALFHPAGRRELELANASIPKNCAEMTLACTLIDGVLVCRAVARRTDRLKRAFVTLWSALRPALTGRAAVMPRIWAT